MPYVLCSFCLSVYSHVRLSIHLSSLILLQDFNMFLLSVFISFFIVCLFLSFFLNEFCLSFVLSLYGSSICISIL